MKNNRNPNEKMSARDIDKIRREGENSTGKRKKETVQKRKISNNCQSCIPYDSIVSDYVTLVEKNVSAKKETFNLYSRTYLIPDINYSSSPESEQEQIMLQYMDLLNGFDASTTVQVTLINAEVNKKAFEKKILLKEQDDNFNSMRDEINTILKDRLMLGQNGIQCKKYITVTVAAVDFETAGRRFINYEAHMSSVLKKIETEPIPLKANDKVRLLADIFRDVNIEIEPVSRSEYLRQAEKNMICPDYFDFQQRDYFMFDNKYARCIMFRNLPKAGNEISDSLFKQIVDTNLSLIITKNIEFIPPEIAEKIIRRQIADMQADKNKMIRQSMAANNGALIGDPTEGKPVSENLKTALELLEDIQSNNQKMMLCQFLIMVTGESKAELDNNTEKVKIILEKSGITPSLCPLQQKQAMFSVLPVGNSNSLSKRNIQKRNTLTTTTTAIFTPFNSRELIHEGGLSYGIDRVSKNMIIFNRTFLDNPNGFFFGCPGSGKSFTAKIEMILSFLATNDEVLVVDPEREYSMLAEALGGEVIYISENSKTHINPMDLVDNPDPTDTEYDPIRAKYDFFFRFFRIFAEMLNCNLRKRQSLILFCVKHMRNIKKRHLKNIMTNWKNTKRKVRVKTVARRHIYGKLCTCM